MICNNTISESIVNQHLTTLKRNDQSNTTQFLLTTLPVYNCFQSDYQRGRTIYSVARLHSGAVLRFFQRYVLHFLLHVIFVVLLSPRVSEVHLVQLIGVHVGVEVRHEGKDDADPQQQAGEQQELFPLQ